MPTQHCPDPAGERARGVALYERALALAPRYPDALYNLGVACSEAGQPERALHLYELAVHFQPACAEAWNNLGARPGPSSSDALASCVTCYACGTCVLHAASLHVTHSAAHEQRM